MDKDNRTSARRVRATLARLMISHAAGKVGGGSDIKRVITGTTGCKPKPSDDDAIVVVDGQTIA
jgi:hypothetical protein